MVFLLPCCFHDIFFFGEPPEKSVLARPIFSGLLIIRIMYFNSCPLVYFFDDLSTTFFSNFACLGGFGLGESTPLFGLAALSEVKSFLFFFGSSLIKVILSPFFFFSKETSDLKCSSSLIVLQIF